MEICLLTDRVDHPVLNEVLARLAPRATTRILEAPLLDEEAFRRELAAPADVYLLKSRSPLALDLGRGLERCGATVLNSTSSTSACLDRLVMADRLAEAGVGAPRTRGFASVRELREHRDDWLVTFPALVKSQRSRRGDLVRKLEDADALLTLDPGWEDEPVVLQEFVDGDGWDVKLWVIGETVHAAKRRTVLVTGAVGAQKRNFPIDEPELPDEWRQIALQVGRAFGLDFYGVDVLPSGRGPLVVDVNAFPGFRSVPDAPAALARFIELRCLAPAGSG
jgi:ribosomal protein S6--L-glutamate ligase